MNAQNFTILTCTLSNQKDWVTLRAALYSQCLREELIEDTVQYLHMGERYGNFLAYDEQEHPIGFIEISIRHDYVNGTASSPVAFIESLYVIPSNRRFGVAARLMKKAEQWAKAKGCKELASDAYLDNTISHDVHKALGFNETERVVYFCKTLINKPASL